MQLFNFKVNPRLKNNFQKFRKNKKPLMTSGVESRNSERAFRPADKMFIHGP